MSLQVRHKISNRTSSMIYTHWIHEIVNKREAKNYIVLEYPDLVQLLIIYPDGKKEKDRILERDKAKEEIKKFPNAFDFEEINVKEQITYDIAFSNKIGKNTNNKKLKIARNKILYFLSFILLFPLFSRKVRIAIKKYIDDNANVIQAIAVFILIALTIYMIILL
jgi:hypothetical protein